MALKSGFYDSSSGDRKYTAMDLSSIFDGIIVDGIFMNVTGQMLVSVADGTKNVRIAPGRAWLNHSWVLNDNSLTFSAFDDADATYPRIDTLCLKVDRSAGVRAASYVVVKGTPAIYPNAPDWNSQNTSLAKVLPLANIKMSAGNSNITASNIQNLVGTSDCPYVTSPVNTVNVDYLYSNWKTQFDEWFNDISTLNDGQFTSWRNTQQSAFDTWYDSIKGAVNGDVGTNLGNQIVGLDSRLTTMESQSDAVFKSLDACTAMHRNMFRGKNLGSAVSEDQLAAIRSGSFNDLWVGDYWTIGGVTYRIADIDYWYNAFNLKPNVRHHAVIVPDSSIGPTMSAFASNDIRGGLLASNFFKNQKIGGISNWIFNAFGPDNVFQINDVVWTSLSTSNGVAIDGLTDYEWPLNIMTEYQVYGHSITGMSGYRPGYPSANWGTNTTQLALFRLNPTYIKIPNVGYWLSDPASAGSLSIVQTEGRAGSSGASDSYGVRPAFAIG